jgi:outer membrane usher protein
MLLAPAAASAAADAPDASLHPLLLNVSINGHRSEEPQLFLQDGSGRTYVSEALLKRWRLGKAGGEKVVFDGEAFFRLEPSDVLKAEVSEPDQTIAIEAAASLFERQHNALDESELMAMTPSATGGFLNYDMFAEHNGGANSLNGAVELGFFSRFGVGATSFVGRLGSGKEKLTRLDTNWTIDRPESLTSLRIGDGISSGGPSAPPVRFGGVQYARNFRVRPGYVTMPLQSVSGSAAVPSVIDVYVNNVLQGRSEVGSGPFDITGIPLQSGGGDLQLVVRDILGREVVSTQNYYASSQLLREGLHDFSYEVGFLRHDFGSRSNSYGTLMASTTHRYGLSNSLTGEGLLQLTQSHQIAGAGLNATLGDLGIVSASANFSHSQRGEGHSIAFAVERSTASFSLGARAELASSSYAYLDMPEDEKPASLTTQAFVDFPFFGGTLGLNYLRRDNRDKEDEALAGAFASFSLGRMGSLQVFARHSTVGRSQVTFGGFLAMPIGGGRSASASLEFDRGRRSSTLTMQKDAPAGVGFGYRTMVSTGSTTSMEGQYQLNSEVASFGVQASRVGKRSGLRLSASGALGMIGEEMFASRRLGSSFGAVRLDGLQGIRVYADNQLIGKTDKSGWLVIPSLRAFETNQIRIDEADFPFDVQIDRTEIGVRPFGRSGAVVDFGVRSERGVLLHVALEDGSELPPGASVFDASGASFVTASGGEIYIPGLAGRAELRAEWQGQACTIDVTVPDNDDPQPLVNGLICTKVPAYPAR